MDKRHFFLSDVPEDLVCYSDRYLKRVIINARKIWNCPFRLGFLL